MSKNCPDDEIAAGVASFAAGGQVEAASSIGEDAGKDVLAVAHLLPDRIGELPPPLLPMEIWTNCSGWLTGRVFRITESIRLKIAVLAPMPSASERIATAANPGLERRARSA